MKRFFILFGKIKSFEIVTLHTSGMRHVTNYEKTISIEELIKQIEEISSILKKHGFDTVSKQYDMIKAKINSVLRR